MKRQERSRRYRPLTSLEHLESRSLLTMTAAVPLPDLSIALGASVSAVELGSYFKDSQAASNDYAFFNTSTGTVPVLLASKTAPATVSSFLSDVNKGDYTNTIVDRSVAGSLWEAGGSKLSADSVIQATGATSATGAETETGGSAVRGTVALLDSGTGAGGTTGRFVFNEGDNSATLDGKATVFGRVVGVQGLATMDSIGAIPVPTASPLAGSALAQAPLQHYTAGQPLQTYNLTKIDSVTTGSGYYETVSDAPGVATATVAGGELDITPESLGTAHVAVVAYGSDGKPATEVFTVNVVGNTSPAAVTTPTVVEATPAAAPVAAPVSVPSLLVPAASGNLPGSVVAGSKTRIGQEVTLTSPSINFQQQERVTLSLSRDGVTPDVTIASTTIKVRLRAGATTHLNLGTTRLPASVPAGPYRLLVSVIDPGGASTTVATGETLTVLAPASRAAK